jgi:uncharacterized membrane protein YdjX (TVP38/TMEM64 family)
VLRRVLERLASPRVRLAILALVVLGAGGALVATGGPSLQAVREAVDAAGPLGAVAFVVGYAGLTVALVPGSALTIAGGVLFGPFLGTALVVVGATAGACAAFGLGRRLGRAGVEAVAGERIGRLDAMLGRQGFTAVLLVRLVPVVPFNVSNYAAGVTAVTFRDFALGTLVGIVPGSFAYAALGGSFDDPTSPLFLTAVGLVVVLAVVGVVVSRRRSRDDAAAAPPAGA